MSGVSVEAVDTIVADLRAEIERQRKIGADLAKQLSAALAENNRLKLRIDDLEKQIAVDKDARYGQG